MIDTRVKMIVVIVRDGLSWEAMLGENGNPMENETAYGNTPSEALRALANVMELKVEGR